MALGQRQPGSGDGRQHFGAEHPGQRRVVEQIRPLPRARPLGAPSLARAVKRRRRHQQMHMRVIVQTTRVGMQHRDGAGRALQLAVVQAERERRVAQLCVQHDQSSP